MRLFPRTRNVGYAIVLLCVLLLLGVCTYLVNGPAVRTLTSSWDTVVGSAATPLTGEVTALVLRTQLTKVSAEECGKCESERRGIGRQREPREIARLGPLLQLARRVAVSEHEDADTLTPGVRQEVVRETVPVLDVDQDNLRSAAADCGLRRLLALCEGRAVLL